MRPFKPPTLVGRQPSNSQHAAHSEAPPLKKRKISVEADEDDSEVISAAAAILKKLPEPRKFIAPARKPLSDLSNPNSSSQSSSQTENAAEGYYTVLWRKFTTKKNKTWDGDGVLSVSGGYARLQNEDGKDLGRCPCKKALLVGSPLSIGGKEIEIESMISKADFLAGRPFLSNSNATASTPKEVSTIQAPSEAPLPYSKPAIKQKDRFHAPALLPQASKAGFKTPVLNSNVLPPKKDSRVPVPRHNPNAEGALVMKRPKSVPKNKQVVDVVVDPVLTEKLRKHQRAGVAFMYECVMGMKDYAGEGAILADEMGLGKTLQVIALVWTLLKQNPIDGDPPVIRKALIVCPVTLINNWRREFRMWLGRDRIGVFVLDDKKTRVTDFTKGRAYNVMIIGYEKLRMVQAELQKCDGIDIVIADEGHRLKTATNKAAQAIKSLSTERRVVLSGTPLQNDLTEFYTMVDFVNPNVLGKYSTFKKEFETAINKGRQPEASAQDSEKGEARNEELMERTGKFILRRTADILSKYLPLKTEYVLFCRPTAAQKEVYRRVIGSAIFNAALGSHAMALELINILKKVCNSPNLLSRKSEKGEDTTRTEVVKCIPPSLLRSPSASGKLQVLDSLLHQIKTTTDEKVVLISNYTSTMDVLATLMSSLSYKFLRLDGSTPQKQRQDLVDKFNRTPQSKAFVFLLSAKAGGTGLNLIGASRLILFDIDWNPATDLQAMARIHREGQKKPCYIYRMLTQGAIDEKIFQRQSSKIGLADSIVDGKSAGSGFTQEELRDLFRLDEGEDCQTHRLIDCACEGNGTPLSDADDEPLTPRNDLAALSRMNDSVEESVFDEDGIEVVNLEDDYGDSGQWRSAKDYDWKAENAAVQKRANTTASGKTKMKSLMQYAHFDTSNVSTDGMNPGTTKSSGTEDDDDGISPPDPLEGIVEDTILRKVLREGGQRIGFVFSRIGSAREQKEC